jgi:hypothetical protein
VAPLSTFVFGAFGVVLALRAAWNPHRAVTKKATVRACAGPTPAGCSQALELTPDGAQPVYAVTGGRVVSVGPDWVHLQASNEPVILGYYGLEPTVAEGRSVMRGTTLGRADGTLAFEVWRLRPLGGGATMVPIEPSSWLASRGLRPAVRLTGQKLWCTGRHLVVPKSVHDGCALDSPDPGGFALLPVSVEQE